MGAAASSTRIRSAEGGEEVTAAASASATPVAVAGKAKRKARRATAFPAAKGRKSISAEALRATAEALKETGDETKEEGVSSPGPASSSSFRPPSAPRVAISAESASKYTVAASGAAATAVASSSPSPPPPSAQGSISALPVHLADPPSLPLPLPPTAPRPRPSKAPESEAAIAAAMDSCFLFQEMEASQREKVVAAMERRYVEAGDTVIREGDEGDNFYVIESGRYRAFRRAKGEEDEEDKERKREEQREEEEAESKKRTITLATYDSEGSFGELALLYGSRRAATVVAETSGVIWALDRASFAAAVHGAAARRHKAVAAALAASPLFAALDDDAVAAVADCVRPEEFRAGDVIVAAGEHVTDSSKFYLVEAGEVECSRRLAAVCAAAAAAAGSRAAASWSPSPSASSSATFSRVVVKPGGWFGEVGLLGAASGGAESGSQTVRAADVVALSPSVRVLSLGRDAFSRLAGGAAAAAIAERLREYQRLDAEAAAAAAAEALAEKQGTESMKKAVTLSFSESAENSEENPVFFADASPTQVAPALDDEQQLRNADDEATKPQRVEEEMAAAEAAAATASLPLLSLPSSPPPANMAPALPPPLPLSPSSTAAKPPASATPGLKKTVAPSMPRVAILGKRNKEPEAAAAASPSPSGASSAVAPRIAGAAALAKSKKPSSGSGSCKGSGFSAASLPPRSPKVARAATLTKKKVGITFGDSK